MVNQGLAHKHTDTDRPEVSSSEEHVLHQTSFHIWSTSFSLSLFFGGREGGRKEEEMFCVEFSQFFHPSPCV